MSKISYYTQEGFDKLKDELNTLKTSGRTDMARQIAEARDKGDLSENAEYHAAKERQSFIEGRIGELSYKIGNAKVIDPSSVSKDVVRFASRVLVENLDTEEEQEYMIVGEDEADIKKGKISVSSPLGSALIGKELGEEAIVQAPGGKRIYEIIDIL